MIIKMLNLKIKHNFVDNCAEIVFRKWKIVNI